MAERVLSCCGSPAGAPGRCPACGDEREGIPRILKGRLEYLELRGLLGGLVSNVGRYCFDNECLRDPLHAPYHVPFLVSDGVATTFHNNVREVAKALKGA